MISGVFLLGFPGVRQLYDAYPELPESPWKSILLPHKSTPLFTPLSGVQRCRFNTFSASFSRDCQSQYGLRTGHSPDDRFNFKRVAQNGLKDKVSQSVDQRTKSSLYSIEVTSLQTPTAKMKERPQRK